MALSLRHHMDIVCLDRLPKLISEKVRITRACGVWRSCGDNGKRMISPPSPPRSGGEGRGEVVLEGQGHEVLLSVWKFVLAITLICAAKMAHAQTAHAPLLNVYDGFETPNLNSTLWSNDRFEAGAVEMETNIVRAGHSAVKITVRPHDKFEAGTTNTSGSERAELLEAKKLVAKENTPYEFSFSMFFPTNFPIEPTRLVIAQWKQLCSEGGACSDDSPVLALRYISGELRITQNLNSPHETRLWTDKGEFRGRWLDFKFQVRFATNETGRVKAWLDGKQVLDFKGVTADAENATTGYPSPSRFYFKIGLYRNSVPAPWTNYIDEYRKKELQDGEL